MLESVRLIANAPAHYGARLAGNAQEIRAAQALRFEVFNLELNEGLAESYASGLDEDPFDAVCDHLIVEHLPSRQIVGTYRLQTGLNAAAKLGYYSAQEFDFQPYEPFRAEIIELGRACVHLQHRNLVVLGMLWKGIADYAQQHGARYLLGCSSITSQDPAVGRFGLRGIVPETSGAASVAHAAAAGIRMPAPPSGGGAGQNPETPARLFERRRENLRAAGAGPELQND